MFNVLLVILFLLGFGIIVLTMVDDFTLPQFILLALLGLTFIAPLIAKVYRMVL